MYYQYLLFYFALFSKVQSFLTIFLVCDCHKYLERDRNISIDSHSNCDENIFIYQTFCLNNVKYNTFF